MSPADQELFFAGAAKHGNLPQAFWEVATDADSMRGDHEQYTKLAFDRALKAEVQRIREIMYKLPMPHQASDAQVQRIVALFVCDLDAAIRARPNDR